MLSSRAKRNVARIIPFGVIWLIFSLVYSLLERGLLGQLDHYPATGNPYHFSSTIVATAITSAVLGLLIGTGEILYFRKLFLRKSFVKKFVYKILVYVAIIISFLLLLTIIYNAIELKAGIFDEQVWSNVWLFFFNFAFWGVEVYVAAVIGITLFYTEISEHIGQGVLHNFFTGKYHAPIEEERIFMFLDMKASTTIAENIGHIRYFNMLRMYFSEMSAPIIDHSGEIYQYVGDEIIVSWELKSGLRNSNCIQCFFAIKSAIQKQSAKYQEKFGLLPEFKAGIHLGKVTTGEIGDIKKDITFCGDVLNTASRIQGLCNTYQVDIIVSEHLVQKLPPDTPFQIKSLGKNELRGRDEQIELFTIIPF